MTIRASSAHHVEALLRDLGADPVTREGAVARLMVIGTRAVERLTAFADDRAAASPARVAALRALEGIGDERALDLALRLAADAEPDVALSAVALARTFLGGDRELPALDGLTAIVLDQARSDAVREAALRAMRDLDAATLSPVLEALLTDPSHRLREAARGGDTPATPPTTSAPWLTDADDPPLPEDVEAVREAVARQGNDVPLVRLLRLVERLREREAAVPSGDRPAWTAIRGAAHVALATRGSRLAVYDLRETLAAAQGPLPVAFLAALTLVGDASCLEPIAAAFAQAAPSGIDDWWPRHLADAFRAIVTRERITRRHAVVKKLEKRWPAAVALWPSARPTRPARPTA